MPAGSGSRARSNRGLVRHAPARSRQRHPYGPGAARPQGRRHDDDLHQRPEPRPRRRPVPGRPPPRRLTMGTQALLGPVLPSPLHGRDGDIIRTASALTQTRLTPSTRLARVVSHLLDLWHVASFAGSLPTHIRQTASPRSRCLCRSVQYTLCGIRRGAGGFLAPWSLSARSTQCGTGCSLPLMP